MNTREKNPRKQEIEAIQQEAERYITLRLDNQYRIIEPTKAEMLKILFIRAQEDIAFFESIHPKKANDYNAKVLEIQKIKRPTLLDDEINEADARKIVALLSIYTRAKKYLRNDNIPETEKYAQLQQKISTATQELCHFTHKYGTPKGYVRTIAIISQLGKISRTTINTTLLDTYQKDATNALYNATTASYPELISSGKPLQLTAYLPLFSQTLKEITDQLEKAKKLQADQHDLNNRVPDDLRVSTYQIDGTVDTITVNKARLTEMVQTITNILFDKAPEEKLEESIPEMIKPLITILGLKTASTLLNINPHPKAKPFFTLYLLERHFKEIPSPDRQAVNDLVNTYAADNAADFSKLYAIFENSELSKEHRDAMAFALLKNANTLIWLLNSEHPEKYAAILQQINSKKYNNSELRELFQHWTKEQFENTLQKNPESQPVLYGIVLYFNLTDEELKKYVKNLNIIALSNDQIKDLDKRVRIAWINQVQSWEEGKKILGGDPFNFLHFEARVNALCSGMEDANACRDAIGQSELGLLLSCCNATIKLTIAFLQSNPETPLKRKMAWNLLQELEEGGVLYQQKNLLAKVNQRGYEFIMGRSYRHRLVKRGVYHHQPDDPYTIEKLYPLVRYDIKNSPADASREAGITAIRLILKDPEIVKHLSVNTSKKDRPANAIDAITNAAQPVIQSARHWWKRLWSQANVLENRELLDVPEAPVPRTCLGQIIECAGQQGLTFVELKIAIDALAENNQEESDLLLKAFPRFFENYQGSISSEENLDSARALVTQYINNGNSLSEIATKIKTRLNQLPKLEQTEEESSVEAHIRDLCIGLIVFDPRLVDKYLENRPLPAPWPSTVTEGLFALWMAWTIASTVSNILGGFTNLLSWRPWKKAEQQSRLLMWALIAISTTIASLTTGGAIAAIILATVAVGAFATLTDAAYTAGKNAWGKITGSSEQAKQVYELITKGFEKNNKSIDIMLEHPESYEKLMQNILFCQQYGFNMRKSKLPNDVTDKFVRLSNAYYYKGHPTWALFVNIAATLSAGLIIPPPWYVKRQVKKYNLPVKLTISPEEKDKKIELRELSTTAGEKDKEISMPRLIHFKKPKKFLLFNHFKTLHQIKFSSQAAIPTDAYKQNIM